jgi:hypothetical protein
VSRDVVERTTTPGEPAMAMSVSTFAAAADQAGIWRELTTAQLVHNVDAFQKLASARGWQEWLAVQQSYVQGTVERLAEATSRSVGLSQTVLTQPRQGRGNGAKSAD